MPNLLLTKINWPHLKKHVVVGRVHMFEVRDGFLLCLLDSIRTTWSPRPTSTQLDVAENPPDKVCGSSRSVNYNRGSETRNRLLTD